MPAILSRTARSLWRPARSVWDSAVDFVYPPACVLCLCDLPSSRRKTDWWTTSLCAECRAELAPPVLQDCQRCGAPTGPFADTSSGCPYCRDDRFVFEAVYRLNVYEGKLREACLRAKSAWGEPMARVLADLVWERSGAQMREIGFSCVIPVPPHWTRRYQQPHSAPETIARRLAAHLQIPVRSTALAKIRRTPRQAGASPTVRRQQQRGTYRCRQAACIAGRTVLLVDDILTTGSTAQAAARALKDAGVRRVFVAAIARGLGRHA